MSGGLGQTSSQWGGLVGIRAVEASLQFLKASRAPEYTALYETRKSNEPLLVLTDVDPLGFADDVNPLSGPPGDSPVVGAELKIRATRKGLMTYVDADTIDDAEGSPAKVDEILDQNRLLVASAKDTIEFEHFAPLFSGFPTSGTSGAGTYNTADGQANFSSAHLHPSQGTFSNVSSADALNIDSVTGAISAYRAMSDGRGHPLKMGDRGFYLVCDTSLAPRAWQLVQGGYEPFGDKFTKNWLAQQDITPYPVHYGAGSGAWFLIPKSGLDTGLISVVRKNITVSADTVWASDGLRTKVIYRMKPALRYNGIRVHGNPGA